MKSFSAEGARFLVVGAINTGLGYLIYLAALVLFSYPIAYTISYLIGVVISYGLNTWFVFRARWSWRRLAAYPLVYALQFALGLGLLFVLVEVFGLSAAVAPLLVVAATIPVTFFASRLVIKGRSR